MSPSNSNELYLVTTEGIFNSQDGGSQWNYVTTLIARGAPENSAMTTFAVRPDAAGTLLFTVGRIIHKTVDGGITWETIETFPSGRKITSLLVDTADPNTVFAGTELVEEKKKGLVSAPSK